MSMDTSLESARMNSKTSIMQFWQLVSVKRPHRMALLFNTSSLKIPGESIGAAKDMAPFLQATKPLLPGAVEF